MVHCATGYTRVRSKLPKGSRDRTSLHKRQLTTVKTQHGGAGDFEQLLTAESCE
jgi:hypothetical protein